MTRENHGTETITVAGKQFEAPVRYSEGHELTAGEASQLNQVFHENLRNNFAKKVKDADEAGSFDAEAFQKMFDEYAEAYEMGIRTGGGGGSRDPIRTEAMRLAREVIKTALKRKGRKVSEIDPSAINDAAKQLIEKGDDRAHEIWANAKKRVEEAQAAAGEDLGDLLDDLPAKPVPQAEAAE